VVTNGNVGIGTWTAASGSLIVNTGNVGIGTITPGRTLDVFGDVRASNSGKFYGDGSQLTGLGTVTGLTTGYLSKATSATSLSDSAAFQASTNIGIGTITPGTKFEVNGQLRSVSNGAVASTSGTSINWVNGNVQITTASCGAITFSNMVEGGSYTLVVTGATSGTCTFSQSSPDTLVNSDFKFTPANGATSSSKSTTYTFIRASNKVYVSWATGF